MKHIIIEGDGIAYGLGAEKSSGWAGLLHIDRQVFNRMFAANQEVVFNAATPGMTIAGVNKRFDAVSSVAQITKSDDMLRVLSVGMSEASVHDVKTGPIVTMNEFQKSLAEYTDRCRFIGAKAILVGAPPVDERKTRPVVVNAATVTNSVLAEYNGVLRNHADQTNNYFIDVRGEFERLGSPAMLLSDDGFNPNDLGHRVIHAALQPTLRELGFVDVKPDLTTDS